MAMDRWRKRAIKAEFEREEAKGVADALRKELAKTRKELAKLKEAA